MQSIPVIDMADVMRKPAAAAVRAGPEQVANYLYEAIQIMLEISFNVGGMDWQAKLALLSDMLEPLLKPIERQWRNKGRRLTASVTFHPLTGEPGILVLEPATGIKRIIYGRKGDGHCIQQV